MLPPLPPIGAAPPVAAADAASPPPPVTPFGQEVETKHRLVEWVFYHFNNSCWPFGAYYLEGKLKVDQWRKWDTCFLDNEIVNNNLYGAHPILARVVCVPYFMVIGVLRWVTDLVVDVLALLWYSMASLFGSDPKNKNALLVAFCNVLGTAALVGLCFADPALIYQLGVIPVAFSALLYGVAALFPVFRDLEKILADRLTIALDARGATLAKFADAFTGAAPAAGAADGDGDVDAPLSLNSA